jgi:ADP-ribose pyrophosphatase YjhB (NUDIX family)
MTLSERVLPLLSPLVARLVTRGGHLTRSMTLGVRVLLTLPDGRIVLVRHGYVAGWYLPGGGVEPGETLHAAARRELAEETGLEPSGPLRLFGVYLNRTVSRRDHVALFLAEAAAVAVPERAPDREIRAVAAFARDALPADVTAATLRRLGEVLDLGAPASEVW